MRDILYWSGNNIGDLFNVYIGLYNDLTSFRKIERSKLQNKNGVFLIGSVIQYISTNNIVMGSGLKDPKALTTRQLSDNQFIYVRGKGTLNTNKLPNTTLLFEPGLLLRKYIKNEPECFHSFVFLPHYDQESCLKRYIILDIESMRFPYDEYQMILHKNSQASMKNKIMETFEQKLSKMMKHDLIVSSSLHGLVFAVALNKPIIWFTIIGVKTEPTFKYHDFFSLFNVTAKRLDIDVENIPNVVNELQYIVKQPKNDNDEFIYDGWLREYIVTIDSQCYETEMDTFQDKLREYTTD
jgi:hypothetical protein